MNTLLNLITFILFILLIIGLVKPKSILRWTNKPSRLKLIGYWFLSIIFISIISIITTDQAKNSKLIIESSQKNIEKGDYKTAIADLKTIPENDSLYISAPNLIEKADSLIHIEEKEKKIAHELEVKKLEQEKLTLIKAKLLRELESIDEGIDFSIYRESIDFLQIELALFGTWAKMIQEGTVSKNTDIQNLAKELKTKVSKIQIKEFPLLRKEYSQIISKKMWKNDIEVSSSGKRNTNLNFIGSIFAANKNKQLFQQKVQEILIMFRFKQSRYRWYKGESEYTYYTVYKGKDSDLVFF